MKLIARIVVILALALLVVGATVALHSSSSAATPTAPSAVVSQTSGQTGSIALEGQSAATTSDTQAGQTAAVRDSPSGARPDGGHEEGGRQGWLGVLKNVGIMAGLVVAVDLINRLLHRVRRRSTAPRRAGQSTPRSETKPQPGSP